MSELGIAGRTERGALLDIESASEHLGITVRRMRSWVQDGIAPPSVRIGRRRYFRREDVEAWLDEKFAG